jgi:hypothetical protein
MTMVKSCSAEESWQVFFVCVEQVKASKRHPVTIKSYMPFEVGLLRPRYLIPTVVP